MFIDLPVAANDDVFHEVSAKLGICMVDLPQLTFMARLHVNRWSVRLAPAPGSDTYRAFSADHDGNPGRRKNAICFHGHREWLRGIFRAYPQARVSTSMATYNGAEDFERTWPGLTEQRGTACRCQPFGPHGERCDPADLPAL